MFLCILDNVEPKVLVSGRDFYAFPRIDPKGERIAWIEWGHPNMPWDRSELWVGYIGENGYVACFSTSFCTRRYLKYEIQLHAWVYFMVPENYFAHRIGYFFLSLTLICIILECYIFNIPHGKT